MMIRRAAFPNAKPRPRAFNQSMKNAMTCALNFQAGRFVLHRNMATSALSSPMHGYSQFSSLSSMSGPVPLGLQIKTSDSLDRKKVQIRRKQGFIIDMDGVIYQAGTVLPGTQYFLRWLIEEEKQFLFLTNASIRTPQQIVEKMKKITGVDIPEEHFYTSALATADFVAQQTPRGSAYVVGSVGLTEALKDVAYTVVEENSEIVPDYVIVGETDDYSVKHIEAAVNYLRNGARLIGTNCDIYDKVGNDFVPSTGSLVAPIEAMASRKAYFIGKPNPVAVRAALARLGLHRANVCIIGDRMDTDILAGVDMGIDTVLLLSGVTENRPEDFIQFGFKPSVIVDGLKDLLTPKFVSQVDAELGESNTQ